VTSIGFAIPTEMVKKIYPQLMEKARFVRITSSGLRESHVHDVIITKELLITALNRRGRLNSAVKQTAA
jgi:S1-C subfamily serine protease